MRYLKLFESNSYTKISIIEYNSKVFRDHNVDRVQYAIDNWDSITNADIIELKKICSSVTAEAHIGYKMNILRCVVDGYKVYIYKLKDEWYYINVEYSHYKCDQMQGVIDCLKSKDWV